VQAWLLLRDVTDGECDGDLRGEGREEARMSRGQERRVIIA
jgi:hypothetical protein